MDTYDIYNRPGSKAEKACDIIDSISAAVLIATAVMLAGGLVSAGIAWLSLSHGG